MRVEFKDLKYRKLSGAEGQKALRRATVSKPKKQASKPSPRPMPESLDRLATSSARIRIAGGSAIDLPYLVAICMDDRTPAISVMPPGLLNTMDKEDRLDLMAYLIAGGKSDHELFAR